MVSSAWIKVSILASGYLVVLEALVGLFASLDATVTLSSPYSLTLRLTLKLKFSRQCGVFTHMDHGQWRESRVWPKAYDQLTFDGRRKEIWLRKYNLCAGPENILEPTAHLCSPLLGTGTPWLRVWCPEGPPICPASIWEGTPVYCYASGPDGAGALQWLCFHGLLRF